ncbi:MFS transporter [Proteus columbae]|uniref:MFS transporter n=1 Tax=Proteus columbae TaxID=1987580 RepID=UPI000C1F17B7|nr:MFS transporter [Proteus columbae]
MIVIPAIIAAASVLGIPIGVFIGEYLGWRGAFIVMGLFSFAVLVLMFICLPSLPGSTSSHTKAFFVQFKNTKLVLGLLITLFLVLGSSAYIATFNLAIALGAYLGGLLVDNYGLDSILLIAILFIASALLCVFSSKYTKCSAK